MTSSSKLDKDDFKYLMDILEEEVKRQYSDIEIRDNVEVAKLNLERLTRIRLVALVLKED